MMKIFRTVLILVLSAYALQVWAEDAQKAYQRGESGLKRKNYSEAIEAFTSALSLLEPSDPNRATVILKRGQAFFNKGDMKKALMDVNTVLDQGTGDGEVLVYALHLRASIHRNQNRDDEAINDLTSAIKTRHDSLPVRSMSFVHRGIVLSDTGKTDRAIGDFNKAIELDNQSAVAYAGRALAFLRKDELEAARRDANTALSMPDDENAAKIANKVLKELSASVSGPASVSVPISDSGHIFVHLQFSKKGKPHRFLLDTGATYTLVNKELLSAIETETEVKEIGKGKVRIADGTLHSVTKYKIKNAYLMNLPLGEFELHVFDGKIRKITNLLGVGSLKNVSISLDNAAKKAELRRHDSTLIRDGVD